MFAEFRQPLWIVAVDFRKAFDSISHEALWNALIAQGVPTTYVQFLQKLYTGQSGIVQTDCLSKPFEINRGFRQGDPISPIIFNSALEALMRKLCEKWARKQDCGTHVRDRKLTNIRFADDLLLFAPTLQGAEQMLSDLMVGAEHSVCKSTNPKRKSFGMVTLVGQMLTVYVFDASRLKYWAQTLH